MAMVKGHEEVRAYLRRIPEALETTILPRAARAGAEVIAVEAAFRSESSEVAAAIKVTTRTAEPGRVVAKVQVEGSWENSVGNWLEYGTNPHFITVDDAQRGGRGIQRMNTQLRENGGNASLVIGGKFVGATVFHPGARPHPFMRPALDATKGEAIAAAQAYIDRRLAREGLGGADAPVDGE